MGHEPHREQRATRREECLTELMRGRDKTAGPMKTKAAQKHPYFLQARRKAHEAIDCHTRREGAE